METRLEFLLEGKRIEPSDLHDYICENAVIRNDMAVSYDGYFKDSGFEERMHNAFVRLEYPDGNAQLLDAYTLDLNQLVGLLQKQDYVRIGKSGAKLQLRELNLSSSEWRLKTIDRIIKALDNGLTYDEVLQKVDDELEGYRDYFMVDQFCFDLEFMKGVFEDFAWTPREKVGFLRMYLMGYLQGLENATINPANPF